jgi:hypothetical protein
MIVRESIGFQRGKYEEEIRDIFAEWRPGKLIINPHTNIVYVFLEDLNNFSNFLKNPFSEKEMTIFSIGHLRNKKTFKNPEGKTNFQIYKKYYADWGDTNFKPKRNLRALTKEERDIVISSLGSEYINKIEKELNLKLI